MKKYLALILVVCLMMSFCSCSKNGDETETASIVSEYKSPEYQFYIESGYGDDSIENFDNAKSVDELKLGLGRERVELDTVPSEHTIEVDGKSVTLLYQNTSVVDKDNLAFDNYNRAYHEYTYKDDNGKIVFIKYMNTVNDFACFADFPRKYNGSEVKLSEDEYKQIAYDELNKRLPEGWDDVYSEVKIDINKNIRWTVVHFYRADMYGCNFRESLLVYLDFEGNLKCFDARQYGLFDEIAESLTQEEIDSAYNAIIEQINKKENYEYTFYKPMLQLDNQGNLYLSVDYSVSDEKGKEIGGNSVYTNVR